MRGKEPCRRVSVSNLNIDFEQLRADMAGLGLGLRYDVDTAIEKQQSRKNTARESALRWYYAHREEAIERQRKYDETHLDARREYRRRYREAHRAEILAEKRRYRERHKAERSAYARAYYAEHRDELRAKARARYAQGLTAKVDKEAKQCEDV